MWLLRASVTNANRSWAARGRLYKDAGLHGPSQSGCNQGLAPVCHGSHYAVRTAVLRAIGGIGPELAEDFTTSFLMNAAGWQGAFAIDAEAHGEGPPTFAAFLVQEHQWSRSLTAFGLGMSVHDWRRFSWPVRVRFGLAMIYYPMLALTAYRRPAGCAHRRGDRGAVDECELLRVPHLADTAVASPCCSQRDLSTQGSYATGGYEDPQLGGLAFCAGSLALCRVGLCLGFETASLPFGEALQGDAEG